MSQAGALVTTGGGGGSSVNTITGNSGVATPVANNINLVTANSTVKFVGSGNTITQDFGLSNLYLGSNASGITTGSSNSGYGIGSGGQVTSGVNNSFYSFGAGSLITTGNSNTAIGTAALNLAASSSSNNTALGAMALGAIAGICQGNIGIGYMAGSAYMTTESSNIVIGNPGVLGESNKIRIGSQGGGANQQNLAYIVGPVLNGVNGTASNPAWSFVNATNCGMLTDGTNTYITGSGFATLTVGFNIVLSGGTNTIAQGFVKSSINAKNANFTCVYGDYFYPIDTSGTAITATLMNNPIAGQELVFKDNTGNAATNNITISGVTSGKNIDGSSTFIINVAFASVTLFYNGTQWNII